ncbi:unnamed protein product, partial [Durusdinium trenchii]
RFWIKGLVAECLSCSMKVASARLARALAARTAGCPQARPCLRKADLAISQGLPSPLSACFHTPQLQCRRLHASQSEGEAEAKKSEEINSSEGAASAESQDTEKTEKTEEASSEVEEAPEKLLQKELADLQELVRQNKHELLLSLADFENNKKRFLKEREDRRRSSMASFATKMVQVYGQLNAFAIEKHDSGTAQALHEGVALTRDLYKASLDKFGVRPLQVEVGEPFVAARHEKSETIESTDLPANSIAEMVRPGWILDPDSPKSVVLQKAEVHVATHGPKVPPP